MTADDADSRGVNRHVLRAARTVVGWTLLSRILGLVRDVLSAARFGAGAVWDAFTFAWTFPNTFRRLFGEGALASAFIPTLTEVRENEGAEGAERLVNAVFTVLLIGLSAITVLSLLPLFVVSPESLEGMVNVDKLDLIVRLLQVMVPYLILICITAFLGAVLQTLGHFAAPAAAPVLLNLCWIAALFGICPAFGPEPSRQIFGIAIAVLVGGLLQIAVCLPPLWRQGVRVRPTLDFRHPAIRRMFRIMLPIVLGMAPTQLNILFDRLIAEALVPGDGANSALYYGTRMMQFPLALVGITMATAVLPTLSKLAARADSVAMRRTLGAAVGMTGFVAIPAAVGLIVLAEPIVRFLFERGHFDATATTATRSVIWGYTLGIPVICAQQVVTRAFYARGDSRTPVRAAVIAMLCNLAFNLALVGPLQETGLALATSLAAVVNLAILATALRAKIGPFVDPGFAARILRTIFNAAVMGGLCVGMYVWVSGLALGSEGFVRNGIEALVPVVGGVLAYWIGASVLRIPEYRELRRVFRERR